MLTFICDKFYNNYYALVIDSLDQIYVWEFV